MVESSDTVDLGVVDLVLGHLGLPVWFRRVYVGSTVTSSSSSSSLERISERIVEQIVDSRGFGGGLQDFRPGQSSSSSSHDPARVSEALDEPGEGFVRTFPQNKKKRDTTSALGVGTASALEPMDAGCL